MSLIPTCPFCGQIIAIDGDGMTERQSQEAAILACGCDEAKKWRSCHEMSQRAKEEVRNLLSYGEDIGMKPLTSERLIGVLDALCELAAFEGYDGNINVPNGKITIKRACMSVKVKRDEKRSIEMSTQ